MSPVLTIQFSNRLCLKHPQQDVFCLYKTSKIQCGLFLSSAVVPKGKGPSFPTGLSITSKNCCILGGAAFLMGGKKGGRDQFGAASAVKVWLNRKCLTFYTEILWFPSFCYKLLINLNHIKNDQVAFELYAFSEYKSYIKEV